MKATHTGLNIFLMAALAIALLGFPTPAHAAGTTFVVTSTADGDLATLALNSSCDLREAIEAANWTNGSIFGQCPAGGSATDPTDTISFSIGASGSSQTITLYAPLDIADDLIIDGTTQPGYAGSPLIRLDGTSTVSIGLFVNGASYSTIKGLTLTRFQNFAIGLSSSNYVTIQANYIGTDGSNDLTTGAYGIDLGNADYALIGGPNAADRNIIAGHNYSQISLHNGSTNNTIQGNYIGVGANGSTPIPASPVPDSIGILFSSDLYGGASSNMVQNNVIASQTTGIINYGSSNNSNTFQENKIGTDATGATALPNGTGISVQGGDGTHIYYNQISGNTTGIHLQGTATNTEIRGNLVGTNAAGMSALPNTSYGVQLEGVPAMMGNPTIEGYNVIAGNAGAGIYLSGAGTSTTTIAGNRIGRGTDSSILANGDGAGSAGIYLTSGASAQVAENWISGNHNNGIFVDTSGTIAAGSTENCITDHLDYGALNTNAAVTLPLTDNWWGRSSGPHHAVNYPSGLGDEVSGYVNAASFLTMPPPACSALEGPRSVDFGNHLVGTGGSQTIVLTNNGTTGAGIPLFIQAQAPFSIDAASTCPTTGGTLAEDASCNLVVKFTAVSASLAMGNVSILTVEDGEPSLIPLRGQGVLGTLLLKNPSFETDANHDKRPDQWVLTRFATATDGRTCTVRKSGTCSLKLAGNGLLKTASQTILKTGIAGDDFSFSLWSKSTSVPAAAVYRLQVQFYNGSTLLSTQTMNFTKGTHAFKLVKGIFTAPGAYTRIVYKIGFRASAGAAWFDSASLRWAP